MGNFIWPTIGGGRSVVTGPPAQKRKGNDDLSQLPDTKVQILQGQKVYNSNGTCSIFVPRLDETRDRALVATWIVKGDSKLADTARRYQQGKVIFIEFLLDTLVPGHDEITLKSFFSFIRASRLFRDAATPEEMAFLQGLAYSTLCTCLRYFLDNRMTTENTVVVLSAEGDETKEGDGFWAHKDRVEFYKRAGFVEKGSRRLHKDYVATNMSASIAEILRVCDVKAKHHIDSIEYATCNK